MEFVNGSRHPSFEPQRREPVSLERFWDEVAWQRRDLEEGDTLVPEPESRCFTVRYRSGGLPAERSAEVTATGTKTMFLSQHQWGEGTAKVGCGDCGALVRVSRKDPAKLSGGELADRVVDLAEARARLDGEYLAALGELAARDGAQGAAHRLREINRMTSAAARSDARLALDLKENDYSDTIEAMRAGEVNAAHARVIAREAPKKHRRSETEFLELARAYPADIVAKHPFAYESNQMYADLAAEQAAKSREPADAEYALQRAERKATLNYGTDGMWHLRGRFDFLTGRRINQALAAAIRERQQHEGSADHTGAQHGADALAALICGETRADTRLLILADYDHTADTLGNPRLDDGTPPLRGTVGPRSPPRRGLLRRLQRRLDQPRPRNHPQRLRRPTPHPRRPRPRLRPLRRPHRNHPRPPPHPPRRRRPNHHRQPPTPLRTLPHPPPPHRRPQPARRRQTMQPQRATPGPAPQQTHREPSRAGHRRHRHQHPHHPRPLNPPESANPDSEAPTRATADSLQDVAEEFGVPVDHIEDVVGVTFRRAA